ncbi:DUF421 domain-containing protein [Rhodovibrio salinarum]|uniref:DUF421 domain-containing protein n=2 Tax=Rhodovibrio salinarum TaxID=1087 RepID=A0A934QFS7_9PROT|nr:DUF421 domain-containing protein [Rhodovibrio salinarum]
MYAVILACARLAGVRSFAEMSNFDIAITIAIGSTIATTIVSDSPALSRGIAGIIALYALQLAISKIRGRFRAAEKILDNRPILLMGPRGRLLPTNMAVARITEDDLRSTLRSSNVHDLEQVQAVIMEGTGDIHVLRSDANHPVDAWLLEGVRDYEPRGGLESVCRQSAE